MSKRSIFCHSIKACNKPLMPGNNNVQENKNKLSKDWWKMNWIALKSSALNCFWIWLSCSSLTLSIMVIPSVLYLPLRLAKVMCPHFLLRQSIIRISVDLLKEIIILGRRIDEAQHLNVKHQSGTCIYCRYILLNLLLYSGGASILTWWDDATNSLVSPNARWGGIVIFLFSIPHTPIKPLIKSFLLIITN